MSSTQRLQGVPRAPSELQKLVHCHLHLPINPPLSFWLDCQPKSSLDILLHWYPDCFISGANCHVYYMGQNYSSRSKIYKWYIGYNIWSFHCPMWCKFLCVQFCKIHICMLSSCHYQDYGLNVLDLGVICGVVGGCMAGMISWLSFASTYPGEVL